MASKEETGVAAAASSNTNKRSIIHEQSVTEQILLHPSQLSEIKKAVAGELNKKIGIWDHERGGVLVGFKGKRSILNGGRGRVVDTSPWIHLVVRYTAAFARPVEGARIYGSVLQISVLDSGSDQK